MIAWSQPSSVDATMVRIYINDNVTTVTTYAINSVQDCAWTNPFKDQLEDIAKAVKQHRQQHALTVQFAKDHPILVCSPHTSQRWNGMLPKFRRWHQRRISGQHV